MDAEEVQDGQGNDDEGLHVQDAQGAAVGGDKLLHGGGRLRGGHRPEAHPQERAVGIELPDLVVAGLVDAALFRHVAVESLVHPEDGVHREGHVGALRVNEGKHVPVARHLLFGAVLGLGVLPYEGFDAVPGRDDALYPGAGFAGLDEGDVPEGFQSLGSLLGEEQLLPLVFAELFQNAQLFRGEAQFL